MWRAGVPWTGFLVFNPFSAWPFFFWFRLPVISAAMTAVPKTELDQHFMPTALSSADFTDFSPPRYLAAQTIWYFSVLDPKRAVFAS